MAKAGISAAVGARLSKTLVAIVLSPLVGFSWRWCWSDRLLAVRCAQRVCGGSPFRLPIRLRLALFGSAMAATTPEDHGHHRRAALFARPSRRVSISRSGSCWPARRVALGTLMGGWRIVRTDGSAHHRLTPMQGFCARPAGAATLFMATYLRDSRRDHPHRYRRHRRRRRSAGGVSAVRWNVATRSSVPGSSPSPPPRLSPGDLLGGVAAALIR
jgi:PiT family inorganic phosphate transporter